MKKIFDFTFALVLLVLAVPVFIFAILLVKLSSSGPAFYKAQRVGRNGKQFVMYKFRTMHTESRLSSTITAAEDPRVFFVGKLLRLLKIDELPQLFNILKGDMSFVGPRPEDSSVVQRFYTPLLRASLTALPGLASPGSLFNYTHGEKLLRGGDTEALYVSRLMPLKVAMDVYYVQHQSFTYDLRIIIRTLITILLIAFGRRNFPFPPEYTKAQEMLNMPSGSP